MTGSEVVEIFLLFREPIGAAMAAGVGLGVLSVFIVLRRVVFLSATLAQSAGLGVTLAFFVNAAFALHVPPTLGAVLVSLLVIAVLSVDAQRIGTTREALLGFLFLTASSLSLIFAGYITQEAHDIHSVLFGSAVLVREIDLYLLMAGAAVTVMVVAALWRGFVFAAFDTESARVQKIPAGWLIGVLLAMVIVMNSIATRALGALPVFAMSTLPAVAALGFTRTLPQAVVTAGVLGAFGAAVGFVVAFFANWPVGSSQAFVLALFSALGLLFRRLRS